MTDPGSQNLGQGQLDITPSTAFLRVLQNVNYKEWYALAEFVDNSIQSFALNEDQLKSVYGPEYALTVDIILDSATRTITIKDNAAGIAKADLERALRPGARPPDTTGLSEFGMGMKNAACWFGDQWHLETKALGDPYVRTVRFDVPEIVRTETSRVDLHERYVGAGPPYTIVTITDAKRFPVRRTLGKVRSHLSSIYRRFIRDGPLRLLENGEPLRYEAPPISNKPYFRTEEGEPKLWKKELGFRVEDVDVKGFVAIRDEGSTRNAGFALFRRRRLIVGSEGDGYRPEQIFRNPNSYTYQRVFGELELTGVGVSYTKDGLIWPESVEEETQGENDDWPPGLEGKFLRRLRGEINSQPLPILDQAEGHRARRHTGEVRERAVKVAHEVEDELSSGLPAVLKSDDRPAGDAGGPVVDDEIDLAAMVADGTPGQLRVRWQNTRFDISVTVVEGRREAPWFATELEPVAVPDGLIVRKLAIRISLDHPFARRFVGAQGENLETLERLAAAMAVAEILVDAGGVPQTDAVAVMLSYVERLLRRVFAEQGIATGASQVDRASQN